MGNTTNLHSLIHTYVRYFTMASEILQNAQTLKTSEVYPLEKPLPSKFENPAIRKGYAEVKKVDKSVLYRTSNSDYGGIKPTAYDMPVKYEPRTQKFSDHIGKCGGADQWRSKGLNTGMKQTFVSGCVVGNNKPVRNRLVRHNAITSGKMKLTDD